MGIESEKKSFDLGQMMARIIRVEALLQANLIMSAKILANQEQKDFTGVLSAAYEQADEIGIEIFNRTPEKKQ